MYKIAKPSLLMTQFARRVSFVAKFRACVKLNKFLLLKLLAKFTVLSDDELLAKFQSVAPNIKEFRQFKKAEQNAYLCD